MTGTTRSRHSLTQPPHLALNVLHSPLLASDAMLPRLPEDEGDIFSSMVLADPLFAQTLCLESKRVPLQYAGLEDLSPLSTSTSTTSFDTTYTTPSSCSLSLSPSSSTATLADKPLPALPLVLGPIAAKEITSLLDLLDRLDDDVAREVVRVKAGIQEARETIGACRAERKKRREVAMNLKHKTSEGIWG